MRILKSTRMALKETKLESLVKKIEKYLILVKNQLNKLEVKATRRALKNVNTLSTSRKRKKKVHNVNSLTFIRNS